MTSFRFLLAMSALTFGAVSPSFAEASAEAPFRVFYFGNSYMANSVPWFQPTLAASAGEALEITTRVGAGWQIWMHVNRYFYNVPEQGKHLLESGKWDAVLIHQFGRHPGLEPNVRDRVFPSMEPWPEPRDVSDPASAAVIIDALLQGRPEDGRVFVYTSWPGIPGAADVRMREETGA